MATLNGLKSSKLAQSSDPNDSVPYSSLEDVRLQEERSAQRIRELTKQRDELFQQVELQRKAEPPLSHPSIAIALEEFHNFFAGYTNFFWSLRSEQVRGHGRTYESVLNSALDNTRRLWEQLSQAINQRYNPAYKAKLDEADLIAARLLTQAHSIVLGKPILYFDKTFQISRHPYQSYPLLGISRDRFEYDGNSSMAHELGHHVFWNNGELEEYAARLDSIDNQIARVILAGEFPDVDFANPASTRRAIRSRFDQYSIWVGWIEETFADVFGTLIAGPQFAKSAQDVLIRERLRQPNDLIVSDGEHPVPALRPFIATSALKAIAGLKDDAFGAELNALVEQLDERWQPIWAEALEEERQGLRKEPVGIHLGHADLDERPAATLDELRKQIAPMVRLLLEQTEFATGPNAQQETKNLLTAVKYWGKERTTGDVELIQKLKGELFGDPISSIAERIGEPTAAHGVEQVPKEANPFDRFLSFVTRRHPETGDPTSEAPEVWETVLEFDLTLDHGLHDYCSDHDRSGCHYHTYRGSRVSC